MDIEYSYLFGMIGYLNLQGFEYFFFGILFVFANILVPVGVHALTVKRHHKFYILAAVSVGFLFISGLIGWVSHVIVMIVSYALSSEFFNDY